MMNREWEDFFGIEEVYDMADTTADTYTGAKKDAAAALALQMDMPGGRKKRLHWGCRCCG